MGFARPRLGTVAQLALLRSQAPYRASVDKLQHAAILTLVLTGWRASHLGLQHSLILCQLCKAASRCSDFFFLHGLYFHLALALSLSLFFSCYPFVLVLLVLRLAVFSIPLFVDESTSKNNFLFSNISKQLPVCLKNEAHQGAAGGSHPCRGGATLMNLAFICHGQRMVYCFFCFPVEPPTKNTLAATVAQYFWTFEKA
jgi:hypothetical protein